MQFGKWKVLNRVENNKWGQTQWICQCNCILQTQKIVIGASLINGNSQSCGCINKEPKKLKNTCNICNSSKSVSFNQEHNKYLCGKHAIQLKRHGRILEKTRFDSNEIIIYKELNYAEIILLDFHQKETGRATIDLEDLKKCKNYKWRMDDHGYAITTICNDDRKYNLLLHHLILNREFNEVVDHKDRVRLNNRKYNLRFCDNLCQNAQNASIQSNNTSGFIGVSLNRKGDKWRSRIHFNNTGYCLGTYENKEDAIIARIEAEIKYFKDYRNPYNEIEFIKRYGEEKILKLFNKT